ncbi:type I-E CRISPR-associated protein Cse2/CasB [Arachnia propionica]|uniref:Type I-E CRISPR-associated protein Cse2/CasB n=1 Tax=Arachnia propionica TaxID=1750 RepID=A0A3P1T251_9ACTN|nr:type I-E CRISPR-associated protein Cse2/CasB [Arachnia propionica]RRD03577.1 type I-E CRISPR-associated protein Cse2/CasB [Arachnia propionica]
MNEEFTCGRFVTSQIFRLIGQDPTSMSPAARGLLAQLRSALGKEPAAVPTVWGVTLDGIPDSLPEKRRNHVETAVHLALTQFAMHQQGRTRPMHSKQPFGVAVRQLADNISGELGPHETPVYKRFTALAQSSTLAALEAHSRGLISQLRSHEIPFDYGRYADDLYWFQVGHQRDVQRRWGRDFHRLTLAPTTNNTPEGEQA